MAQLIVQGNMANSQFPKRKSLCLFSTPTNLDPVLAILLRRIGWSHESNAFATSTRIPPTCFSSDNAFSTKYVC